MPRDGTNNLIPPRSKEEAKKRGKKGGIASGKARREKKALRETMEEMLKVALKDDNLLETYGKFGFAKKGMTMQDAIAAAMIHQAAKGNVKAYQAIKDTLETAKAEDKEKTIADRLELMRNAFARQTREKAEEDDGDE